MKHKFELTKEAPQVFLAAMEESHWMDPSLPLATLFLETWRSFIGYVRQTYGWDTDMVPKTMDTVSDIETLAMKHMSLLAESETILFSPHLAEIYRTTFINLFRAANAPSIEQARLKLIFQWEISRLRDQFT